MTEPRPDARANAETANATVTTPEGPKPAESSDRRTGVPAQVVALLRLVFALATVAAIVATFFDSASNAPVNPFNFFGFFTIQGNLIMVVVLIVTAVLAFTAKPPSSAWQLVRGSAVAYMIVVGVVYNTLLTNVAGGVSLPWANSMLHVVLPLYVAIDWLVFDDRPPLGWRTIWVILFYPAAWVTVVLIRGATDGWVPYPFLNPANGYGSVTLYCVGILVVILAGAAAVWGSSRLRVVHVRNG
ncbi:Pr6Pr family membrane protein [Lysinibacter cavernae]|uniref:F420-dependent oxidoreductase n=1 Tax=Lysinibacter cavernae TaxID=1640652 RepID=A0A7X5R3A1_9MICO|nr:Pr6Pr family membrane protein [Lysinibacter cavernae]NIH54732.1 hypothetical protein [Lysinibacter cavernae]